MDEPPTIDPAAAGRWLAQRALHDPWLHQEVARRMAERLQWIRLPVRQWVHWLPEGDGARARALVPLARALARLARGAVLLPALRLAPALPPRAAPGAALAAVFGWLVIWLGSNQYATGLALMLFGTGLSAFVGTSYVQESLPGGLRFTWWGLGDIPVIGPALFRQHPLAYGAMLLTALMIWWLYRTRAGLVLRSVGESPDSANALGYSVRRIRLAAVVFGGAMSGLAGAYLSLVYTPLWTEGMVAGRGWIALALVVFGTWRPLRVLLGAYLFGGVMMLQFYLQSQNIAISSEFLASTPYLATIIVLALISRNATWIRINMPASLGKAFNPVS